MTSTEIRQQFLDFFRAKNHEIVDSSPVVPFDDPTLMFTNAGMNQFKDVFLATGTRPYNRAADTQKCIRAGGKHNDLDDVGQDTYHHTFFEMLGNWSFGDYFKKEAIQWAWELLTEVWKIPKERLHATYFEGDPAEGLEPDSEAKMLWETVTDINHENIHPGNKKDNFWEMGDQGPCGPCSELHIDLTKDLSGAALVNGDDARVIEIWNLVFIQFNRAANRKLSPLPAQHVDTGMGFERLCAVLQGMAQNQLGKITNYDTDVFTPIFQAIQKRTKAPNYTATLPTDADQSSDRKGADNTQQTTNSTTSTEPGAAGGSPASADQVMIDVSYRVIADHIRCLTFALTDGATPSNEGRGYVLRRILRRAVRYGRQYMNMQEPFLCDLIKPIIDHMATAFPELKSANANNNTAHVTEIIRDEEKSFGRTFDRGLKLYRDAADNARANTNGKISGQAAFKLHDTFGFTIDLTQLMAEEDKLTIDIGEYERLMEQAREKARATDRDADTAFDQETMDRLAATGKNCDDSNKYEEPFSCEVSIWGLGPKNTPLPDSNKAKVGEQINFATNRTPLYAEQGGQVSDTGTFQSNEGSIVRITDIVRQGKHISHFGIVESGEVRVGSIGKIAIDHPRRSKITKNHTSTHILNWSLRELLGDHIQQKGSLVDPEKTRFDFSHNKPLTNEELLKIEALCNLQIEANYQVLTKEVDQKEALKIKTLRAVFGEKYPDRVRVVSIGVEIGEEGTNDQDTLLGNPENPAWMKHSVEFCGGTHLSKTRVADRLVITNEEGVAKGIRRLVAITGDAATNAITKGDRLKSEATALEDKAQDLTTALSLLQKKLAEATIPLRTRHQIQDLIANLQKQAKAQQKQASASSGEAVQQAVAALFEKAETINDVTVVTGQVPAANTEALRTAIDWVRNKTTASAILLATINEGKVILIAGMSKEVVKKGIKAGDLIKEICPIVGGKGGGRPDMAQGGGSNPEKIPEAIAAGKAWIAQELG